MHHVESGLITLIGATTENPSFEVIAPLLSRCRVITLDRLTEENLAAIIEQALNDRSRGLGELNLKLTPEAREAVIQISDGDGRVALNCIEVAASLAVSKKKMPFRLPLKIWKPPYKKKRLFMTKMVKNIII